MISALSPRRNSSAACSFFGWPQGRLPPPPRLNRRNWSSCVLHTDQSSAIRATSIESTSLFSFRDKLKRDIPPESDFESLVPMARAKRRATVAPRDPRLLQLLDIGDLVDFLPAVSPGVQAYINLCALIDTAHIPPTIPYGCSAGAVFSPGRTYSLYAPHLSRTSARIGVDALWSADEVAAAARGMGIPRVPADGF